MAQSRTTTAVRFPAETHDQLRVAADERGLSINWLVVRAVEDYLSRLLPPDEMKLTH